MVNDKANRVGNKSPPMQAGGKYGKDWRSARKEGFRGEGGRVSSDVKEKKACRTKWKRTSLQQGGNYTPCWGKLTR